MGGAIAYDRDMYRTAPLGLAIVAAAGVSAAAREARADRCGDAAAAWTVHGGALAVDADCDGVLLSADGDGRTSAAAALVQPIDGDVALRFRWQRLSPDSGGLEAAFGSGVLVFHDGRAGIYVDEASWQRHGFDDLPAPVADLRETDDVAVEIALVGDDVTVRFDGVVVTHRRVGHRPTGEYLTISVRGQVGARSRARVVGAQVVPLKGTGRTAATGRDRAASSTRGRASR